MKSTIILIIAITASILCKAQQTTDVNNSKNEIINILNSLEKYINEKNVESVLSLYDQTDTLYLQEIKQVYGNWFEFENLVYKHRICSTDIDNDTAKAILYCFYDYTVDNTTYSDIYWMTYILLKNKDGWRIQNKMHRSYASTIFTELEIKLDTAKGEICGKATYDIKIVETGEDNLIFILNNGLEITNVTIPDGSKLDFEKKNDRVVVRWPNVLEKEDSLTVILDFKGVFHNTDKNAGYTQLYIGNQGAFACWSTSWYPFLEGNLKSKGKLTYFVPKGWLVASNGKQTKFEAMKTFDKFVFETNSQVAFSFAANKYYTLNVVVNDIQVGCYFLEENQEKARIFTDSCAQIIKFLESIYGKFPYEKYAIVELPGRQAGGFASGEEDMIFVSLGLAIYNDVFNLPIHAHEIGHVWWGNLVGGAWGQTNGNIIMEGLAQMSTILCMEAFHGKESVKNYLKYGTKEYTQSAEAYFKSFTGQNDMELAVKKVDNVSLHHDLICYKGHLVYNMIREKIGDKAFSDGLKNIVSKYKYKNIGLNELQEEWEKQSGMNLDVFFEQWFYRKGAPEFSMDYTVITANGQYSIKGRIFQLREIYTVEAELGIMSDGVQKTEIIKISEKETNFSFTIPLLPDTIIFDPDYKIFRWTEEFKTLEFFNNGIMLYTKNEYEKAIEQFLKISGIYPDNKVLDYYIARSYQNLKVLDTAITYFEKNIEEYKKTKELHWTISWSFLNMGKIYLEQGDNEKAKACLNQVLSLPNDDNSHDEARKLLN
ncbi:MAG: M1 family aminopeptidase [Bacteroidota bacterium]